MKKLLSLVALLATINACLLQVSATSHHTLTTNNNKLTIKNKVNATRLDKVIISKNFFIIKTGGLALPSSDQIITAAKKLNISSQIDWSAITVDENSITTTTATLISANQNIYTGSVQVKYTIDISANLKDLIKQRNLGLLQVASANNKTSLQATILTEIKKLNPAKLDWTKIAIDEITLTATGAEVVSLDTSVYSGSIDVSFNLEMTRAINLQDYEDFNGTSSNNTIDSKTYIIFNDWTEYSSNWNSFTEQFAKITFDSDSFIEATNTDGNDRNSNIIINMNNVTSSITTQVKVAQQNSSGLWYADIIVSIAVWHDDHNVYLLSQMDESAQWGSEGLHGKVNLTTAHFPISKI